MSLFSLKTEWKRCKIQQNLQNSEKVFFLLEEVVKLVYRQRVYKFAFSFAKILKICSKFAIHLDGNPSIGTCELETKSCSSCYPDNIVFHLSFTWPVFFLHFSFMSVCDDCYITALSQSLSSLAAMASPYFEKNWSSMSSLSTVSLKRDWLKRWWYLRGRRDSGTASVKPGQKLLWYLAEWRRSLGVVLIQFLLDSFIFVCLSSPFLHPIVPGEIQWIIDTDFFLMDAFSSSFESNFLFLLLSADWCLYLAICFL